MAYASPTVTDPALSVSLKAIIKLHNSGRVGNLNSVKRWHYIVLGGLIAGIACAYLYRQELGITGPHGLLTGTTPSIDQTASSSRPALIRWQTVDRSGDGFKVEMPTDVKEIQVPAYNEQGGADQVSLIFANPNADTTFSLAWADNPPVVRINRRAPDRILDMARDDALAHTQTSLVGETRTSAGGSPARDFVGKNAGGGIMNVRLVYTGERLYMLTASFPSTNARREQDVTRFFNSFTIVSSASIPESMPAASAPAS